ncbi:hypothetical protein VCRA2122O12_130078 [Vibrio crassostreae]|nr:hypothetical protein VCRA2114E5_130099 [Vibrio crassostreae]CAK2545768.1 hypothetical protein VCRA2110O2_120054 [Vibrio crassostreae]CAK3184694.1 hypothetical protein VCRA2122O12_130078 [Vibrio crassostreae]CAK3195978.1 hypothetical protein VCRA2120O9_130079 [Vibrio crassostreae]CAK3205606.1 hypothetical protein VCRA2122O11_140079 [Vibrio crassostreae]
MAKDYYEWKPSGLRILSQSTLAHLLMQKAVLSLKVIKSLSWLANTKSQPYP